MGKLAEEVLAGRAERDAARDRLDRQIARLKDDIEERGISGRVMDEVSETASKAFDEAMQVAGESKGVIAGTIALLAIWFMRNPIIAWLEDTLGQAAETEGPENNDDE